ncbi:diguanylate cyclase (GGDEF)-like protein [Kitasatospora sp. SolWspMP-SS2h]|uniref:GGDEF domain-containing protein n=1 Tax=Kitasatospora sp. SolWspMP-SS2h TaxID=1305729 RepID=UPI000DB92F80|nr:GGDEF domain-containing protein [Kitasatospora sp. SolWspMP-SS2h]RAJ36097.1 diguanylate cyclase (GGDEF)-like protein [Kitasatospora sp. SolWspMP-SS2h]
MSTPLLLQALAALGAAAPAAAGVLALRRRRDGAERGGREAELLAKLAELTAERDELVRTASCDPLTGVWNYRHLQLTLDREIERARRAEATAIDPRPLAVLMIEVAGFDAVVAEHGRARANAMLRDLAQRLAMEIRGCDTLGRYGGEEFLALLPDTGPEGAAQVAERLCWSVRRHRLTDRHPGESADPGERSGLTASVGLAVLPRDGAHSAVLLRAADRALAAARAAGGDRWRSTEQLPPEPAGPDASPAPGKVSSGPGGGPPTPHATTVGPGPTGDRP